MSGGKLTDKRVAKLRAELEEHYGERVATASEHCEALTDWMNVMVESGYAPDVGKAWGMIYLTLMKSNLAARLVYGGEKIRTVPCPTHKGRWSGCKWGDSACKDGCMSGSNVTGWLHPLHPFEPWPDDAEAEKQREYFNYDPALLCRVCGGVEDAPPHASVGEGERTE